MRVAVVGGGVVGAAVTLALARRGVDVVLLEAAAALALAASGTNSGILHTGFDSVPGELETRLIHRSVALREAVTRRARRARCCAAAPRWRRHPTSVIERRASTGSRSSALPRHAPHPGRMGHRPGGVHARPRGGCRACGRTRCAPGSASWRWTRDELRSEDGRQEPGDVVCNCAGLHARRRGAPVRGRLVRHPAPEGRVPGVRRAARPDPAAGAHGAHQGCAGVPHRPRRLRRRADGRRPGGQATTGPSGPRRHAEIIAKAVPMHPALEGAEPVDSYAGLRPAGVGANYVIGRSTADRRLVNRGRHPLDRAVGGAGHRRARRRAGRARHDGGAAALRARQPRRPARGGGAASGSVRRAPDPDRPVRCSWASTMARARSRSSPMTSTCGPSPAPRRAVTVRHPRPAGSSRTPDEVLEAVVDAVAQVLDAIDGDGRCLRHRPPGRIGAGVGCRDRPAAGTDHRLAGQARGRGAGTPVGCAAGEVTTRSGLPLDPYFSAASLAWLVADGGLGMRRRAPARDARRIPLRPARRRACHRPVDRLTHPALSGVVGAGEPGWDPRLLDLFGVPVRTLAHDHGQRRRPGGAASPALAPGAATAGARGRPAGRPGRHRLRPPGPVPRRPTAPACSCSRTRATPSRQGRSPGAAAHRRLAHRRTHRVRASMAASSRRDRCSAGWPRAWDSAPTCRRCSTSRRAVPDSAGVRILPALAGLGAPWWRPDARGIIAGSRRTPAGRTSRGRRSTPSPSGSGTSCAPPTGWCPSRTSGSTAG